MLLMNATCDYLHFDMSSLADRLIDDLGGSDDSDTEHDEQNKLDATPGANPGEADEDLILPDQSSQRNPAQSANDLGRHVPVAFLDKLRNLETQVTNLGSSADDMVTDTLTEERSNDMRDNVQYKVVIACAAIIGQVDEVIASLHTRLTTLYRPGFPELETLVVNAMDYARVVSLACESEGDFSSINLRPVLPSASVITVQITASSTAGRKLSHDEWKQVAGVSDAMLQLDRKRTTLLSYIQSHAKSVAPNLVAVVGGVIAAKLIAQAGGLEPLAAMPGGNLKVIGKSGNSVTSSSKPASDVPDDDKNDHTKDSHKGRHGGFIHLCPIVLQLPPKHRRKAGDIVAGKASLAARVDAQRQARDGSMGRKLYNALDAKFIQMQQRPPAKSAKPLPIPGDEAKRRHRGGARARKEKERLGLTEAWKLANRQKFGVAETVRGNDLENEGLGMLGAPDSQRLKVATTKARGVSLAAKRKLEKHKKKEGVSDAEKFGISSDVIFSVPPPPSDNASTSQTTSNVAGSSTAPGQPSNLLNVTKGQPQPANYFTPSTPFLGVDKKSRPISKET